MFVCMCHQEELFTKDQQQWQQAKNITAVKIQSNSIILLEKKQWPHLDTIVRNTNGFFRKIFIDCSNSLIYEYENIYTFLLKDTKISKTARYFKFFDIFFTSSTVEEVYVLVVLSLFDSRKQKMEKSRWKRMNSNFDGYE